MVSRKPCYSCNNTLVWLVWFVVPRSLTYQTIPGGSLSIFLVYWGIRGRRTMPYAIRELWLSMNTIPFRLCPSGPQPLYISMHAAVHPMHLYPTLILVHTVTHIHTYTFIGHTNRHLYRHIRERKQLLLELNINQYVYCRERVDTPIQQILINSKEIE